MGFLEIFIYFIIIMIKFFLFILLFYCLIKNVDTEYTFNKALNYKVNEFKVLTYNVQRLPFMFRPTVDIKRLMDKYDVICLQENFCNIFGSNKISYGFNCVSPGSAFYKLVDSGLSIYSKFPIQFIEFIRFNNLTSVDKLSDKGFLVVQLNDLIIVNTHLQATYELDKSNFERSYQQLSQIVNYVRKYKKVLICGDINMNIQELPIENTFSKIYPPEPTHWTKMESFLSQTSADQLPGYLPYYYDGGFYKGINVKNIKCTKEDVYTDHLGVTFEIN
jgi:exonuclease III